MTAFGPEAAREACRGDQAYVGRDENQLVRHRGVGQRGDSAHRDRQAHPGAENTDGLVRRVRLADASAGRDADHSDDRPKEAGHDCPWVKVRDFQLVADRGCPSAWDAAADPKDAGPQRLAE